MEVLSQENAVDTKAVVIMFGWFRGEMKHLKKYADLYVHHPTHKCDVVYGIASSAALITRNESKLAKIVMDAVQKAVEAIQTAENAINYDSDNDTKKEIPVILHHFSNGGAFVVEQFWLMMKEATLPRETKSENPKNTDDLKFISKRLKTRGFEVLDSAPAYLYDDTAQKVIDSSVQNFPLRMILRSLVSITIVLIKTSAYIHRKGDAAQVFWSNMLESDLCRRQVFVYSSVDKITVAEKLTDFIEARRKQGIDITVLKFDDSDHVLHMKKYPEEYKEKILDYVLDAVTNDDGGKEEAGA